MEHPIIIAGPCSVESREQLMQTALELRKMPQVSMIRAGVWKPRTRPGGFEGLGEPALAWIQETARETGMTFCCEVARPEHVELCRHYGIENVWLGARTTANPFMVEELCEALRGSGMRVMVKNPMNPDVRLWIGAIERLQQSGTTVTAAIHRGFSMYNNHCYRNEPLWEVPMELQRRMPDMPLLCDPSHIAGRADLVPTVAYAAMRIGFDGLMVEVHPSPAQAFTDAQQQLSPADMADLLASLPLRDTSDKPSEPALESLRRNLDEVDHEMIALLGRRMSLARQIAELKRRQQMPIYQPKRWDIVVKDRLKQAESLGIDTAFLKEILEKIHGESVRIQMEE